MLEQALAWPGRLWRIVATALAFATFGLGGLLLWWVVFPLQGLLVREPLRRQAMARAMVGWCFRVFVRWMRVLGLISYELHGLQRLQRCGLLVLANHPTLIDVVFLIGLVPNASCVIKAALAQHPSTRGPVLATGYICNNSGSDLLQACANALQAGSNLIVFPEGTRTRPGRALSMHRGAAQMALRAGVAITPVHIRCTPLGLYKGQPWWQVAARPLHFSLSVGPDLPTMPYLQAAAGQTAKAARCLTDDLITLFSNPEPTFDADPARLEP